MINNVIGNIGKSIRYDSHSTLFKVIIYGQDIELLERKEEKNLISYLLKVNIKFNPWESKTPINDMEISFTISTNDRAYDSFMMDILNHEDSVKRNLKQLLDINNYN